MADSTISALAALTNPLASDITVVVSGGADVKVKLSDLVKAALSGGSFMRNKIINGGMYVDQRNNGSSSTITSFGQYGIDKFTGNASVTSKFSLVRNTKGSGTGIVLGSVYTLLATSLSAYAVVAGDTFYIGHGIEADLVGNFAFGTAQAKTITLSFSARSSQTGTFGGCVRNAVSGATRSYPFTYSIPVANTWTTISVTIPGDTAGTWQLVGGLLGMQIVWSVGTGTTASGTAGAWASANLISATGAVSIVATNTATLEIADVQLEDGPVASAFEQRLGPAEMVLCNRYCYVAQADGGGAGGSYGSGFQYSTTLGLTQIAFPAVMRANPSFTIKGTTWQYQIPGGTNAITGGNTIVLNQVTNSQALLGGTGTGYTAGTNVALIQTGVGQLIFSADY